jgi:hypothetical protein
MSQQAAAARTPGATRAGEGEYVFDLAKVNHILGGPDYSTASGACVEGDRMIVGLMQMPAGSGAEPHSHPNEQWIYILQGTFRGKIGDKEIEAKPTACMESRRRDRRRLRESGPIFQEPMFPRLRGDDDGRGSARSDSIARLIACFRAAGLGYN